MCKTLLLGLALASAARAEPWYRSHHFWSEVAVVAAASLDTASSIGQPEGNPLLATRGHFKTRGVAIKFGVVGVGLAVQHITIRKAPKLADTYYLINMTVAGATAGTAIYNWKEIGGGR